MVHLRTDTDAVVALGAEIAGLATMLDGAVAGVARLAGPAGIEAPAATATQLPAFTVAYRRSTQRLRDDVLALGRLTQATGNAYAEVEGALARLVRGGPHG